MSTSFSYIMTKASDVRFVLDQHAELDFIVLAHWNNSRRIDMSPDSDTLSCFRTIQYLLFLLIATIMTIFLGRLILSI